MRAMFRFSHHDTPEQRAERLLTQGERLMQRGKESEGIRKFTEAAELLPEASLPNVRLGRAYAKRQEFDLALTHYYKGLFFCDTDDEAGILCEIAMMHLRMGRYDLAEEKFHSVLQMIPDSSIAWQGLAYLYERTGQTSEALAILRRMSQQSPDDRETLLQLVEALRQSGKYQEAQETAQQALTRMPAQTPPGETDALRQALKECAFPDGEEFGGRELLYARCGAICLGSADDDGVTIPLLASGAVSDRHVVATLARFLRCVELFGWDCRCVVAADKSSRMFAAIVACLLRLPLKFPAKAAKNELALLCQWSANAASHRKTLNTLRRRTSSLITFAFLAEAEQRDPSVMPDIVGLPLAHCADIAWKNADGRISSAFHDAEFWGILSRSVDLVIAEYCRRVCEFPDEADSEQRVEFYRREPVYLRPHLFEAAMVRQAFPVTRALPLAATEPDALPPSMSESALIKRSENEPVLTEEMIGRLHLPDQTERYLAMRQLRLDYRVTTEIDAALAQLVIEQRDDWLRHEILAYWLNADDGYGVDRMMSVFSRPRADVELKALVLETVGQTSDRRISALFVSALNSLDERLRAAAAQHLDRLDESQPLSEIFERLLYDIPAVQIPVIRYLAARRSQQLPPHFTRLLESDESAVLRETLQAIHAYRDRSCLNQVEALLTRDHELVQEHALRTLGAIGEMDAVWAALEFLDHPNPAMRYAAVECVMTAESRRSPVFLMERLRKETPDAQMKLIALCGDLGMMDMIPFLLRLAEQHFDSLSFAQSAMQTFARLPHSRCLPFARKAVAAFPTEEVILPYLALVNAVGEEADRDLLIPLLGYPPAIRLRAAGLLQRYGFEQYGRILRDALHSSKRAVNLLAVEALAELADEASLALLITVFEQDSPLLDRKLAEAFSTHGDDARYVRFLQGRSADMRENIRQGLLRAMQASRNAEDAHHACQALSLLLEANAITEMRQYAAPPHPATVRCDVMRWLAGCDNDGSRSIFQHNLDDDHLDVANTAYRLLSPTGETRQIIFASNADSS